MTVSAGRMMRKVFLCGIATNQNASSRSRAGFGPGLQRTVDRQLQRDRKGRHPSDCARAIGIRRAPSRAAWRHRSARRIIGLRQISRVPHLLGHHAALIREILQRPDERHRIATGRQFVMAALAGQNRPAAARARHQTRCRPLSAHSHRDCSAASTGLAANHAGSRGQSPRASHAQLDRPPHECRAGRGEENRRRQRCARDAGRRRSRAEAWLFRIDVHPEPRDRRD